MRIGTKISFVENWRDEILIVLSLLFFISYGVPIAFTQLSTSTVVLCEQIQMATWVLFGVDYVWRLVLCDSGRMRFIRQNWLDLVVLAVPAFRALRLLRAASAATFVARSMPATASFRLELSAKLAGTSLLVWLLAGFAVTEAERGSAGAIQEVGQGLWWALTTMATVGYGDLYPVTVTGRLIGGCLMIMGIVIFSIITGTMATWIMERMKDTAESLEEQGKELAELKSELQSLRQALEGNSTSK